MLEIKTVTANTAFDFDTAVNAALADGWDLVRRECFITGADRAATFYAELERIIDEQEEEYTPADFAKWEITRDPHHPYRCSNCGFKAINNIAVCPYCSASMSEVE